MCTSLCTDAMPDANAPQIGLECRMCFETFEETSHESSGVARFKKDVPETQGRRVSVLPCSGHPCTYVSKVGNDR